MDLILYNGQIYSMENEYDIHSAMSIQNGYIQNIGSDEEILSSKTDYTQLIDLNQKLVFPGFNDSHMHLMGYGAALCQVDLSKAKSIQDVISITKAFIKNHAISKNSWVLGRGWNQDYFIKSSIPSCSDLDEISTEHFIFLRRACGHVASVNSKVLETHHLSTELTEVDGGEYHNGIFKENAMDLILNNMPEPTSEDMKIWISKGIHALHEMGITSVQSDDLCVFPEHLSEQIIDVFTTLDYHNELNLRVYEQSLFRSTENLKTFIEKGYSQNKKFKHFKYGPLKILGDGSLGGRTAWMKASYADADTHGIHMYEQNELNEMVLIAHKNHIASAIHCIGDAMLDAALDAIENAQQSYPDISLRHGIVHCQITRPDQLQRMQTLHVMAYVQPIFLDYDIHIVRDRVGEELASTSYSWKTMMNLGIRTSFGSDAPVETPDPIKGIHCAVTRKDLKNRPREAYLPLERVSVFEALRNYTYEGAFASYDESDKGMIKPGYLADLVILEGNIFESILDNKVFMTIFDGKIVYKKQ